VLKDRDRNGLLEYAQKFVSSPGKQDGLYDLDEGRAVARVARARRRAARSAGRRHARAA
jgi:hypothetical protein